MFPPKRCQLLLLVFCEWRLATGSIIIKKIQRIVWMNRTLPTLPHSHCLLDYQSTGWRLGAGAAAGHLWVTWLLLFLANAPSLEFFAKERQGTQEEGPERRIVEIGVLKKTSFCNALCLMAKRQVALKGKISEKAKACEGQEFFWGKLAAAFVLWVQRNSKLQQVTSVVYNPFHAGRSPETIIEKGGTSQASCLLSWLEAVSPPAEVLYCLLQDSSWVNWVSSFQAVRHFRKHGAKHKHPRTQQAWSKRADVNLFVTPNAPNEVFKWVWYHILPNPAGYERFSRSPSCQTVSTSFICVSSS